MQFSEFITLPSREKCNLFLSGCSIRKTGPEKKNISFGMTGKLRPSGGSLSRLHRAYKLHNQPVLLNNFFREDGGKLQSQRCTLESESYARWLSKV